MIKAIALDMDGTLLDPHHDISEELIHLLTSFRENGVRLFLATGRTLKEVNDVLPEALTPDGIVGGNGMVIEANNQLLTEHEVETDLVNLLADDSRKLGLYYEIHPSEGTRFAYEKDKEILREEVDFPEDTTVEEHEAKSRKEAVKSKIHWIQTYPEAKILKIYFFSKSQDKIKQWKKHLEELKQDYQFSTSSSSQHNVEVMAGGVNKGTGVQQLLDYYGVDSEHLIAVGDANNDLPLLRLAGIPAVMKNGSDEVKKEINNITDYTNEENGLYHFLTQYKQD
ncbi:Cof-type HAD-IIB family hydrolase [Salipaludibacillus aurantiacus]|uniref:Cof subfamily of IIB subfamily of haloacid dehalogenase superfamily/HAD-superfamily hydrolase, subfamily IIB n=1 Tax=Salipaludibacillus aurantiacus TaxID=1601833 RepID=A0A1H9UC14_9BACI|nr:Cof-type HAD-IIB family hydrolase [Salipaludibacillus aurantiacus]SES06633.1 hypothetical protein SAMN05518684_10796 [Salipaludibacillus aurantiacus]